MEEIVINLHMHTRYSDGSGSHAELAAAALRCGLDAIIVTDHNVLVRDFGGYVKDGRRRVLMLIGEEVHDQDRDPERNHLLILGTNEEMARLAPEPASLIHAVHKAGGLSFIAHLTDPAAPAFNERDIPWEDWAVGGFAGLEIWNCMSELKTYLHTRLHGVLYACFPALVAHGPPPNSLKTWDQLCLERRVAAIGGSDAHAFHKRMGPFGRVIFPYEFHFRAVNTHVLLARPLAGEARDDERSIYAALAAGHCFVGYDLPHSTRGFRFTAHGQEEQAIMGDEIACRSGVTLQAYVPSFAEIRLLRNGKLVQSAARAHALTYLAGEPGAYRVEAYRRYLGLRRGWIFSNPIYVR